MISRGGHLRELEIRFVLLIHNNKLVLSFSVPGMVLCRLYPETSCKEQHYFIERSPETPNSSITNNATRVEYRKYQSLGTPPRPTFQDRLLHNQEDVNTDRYV